MNVAKLQLGTWGLSDLISTLFAVAVLVIAEVLFLSQWLSPPAMAAGCCVAMAAGYLHYCGNSLFKGPWIARLMFLIILLAIAIIAGGIATLVFGK